MNRRRERGLPRQACEAWLAAALLVVGCTRSGGDSGRAAAVVPQEDAQAKQMAEHAEAARHAARKEALQALSTLAKSVDEMEQTATYSARGVAGRGKSVSFYFVQNTGAAPKRAVPNAEGDDGLDAAARALFGDRTGSLYLEVVTGAWAVPDKLTFKVDEELWELPLDQGDVALRNVNVPLAERSPKLAKALASAKRIRIRVGSDRSTDFTLPASQVAGLAQVYKAWLPLYCTNAISACKDGEPQRPNPYEGLALP